MRLERGQVAVVTGAASGLGLGLAEAFAARGLDVVLADVEATALDAAVTALEDKGAAAIGVRTDVRFAEQVDALAAATLERFGRVDVICNNAGVSTFSGPTWEVPLTDWDWLLGVNLHGVIHGIRAFVPHLVRQGSGHVVNTASMAGISVGPTHAPYLASKHAVVALTEGLAAELAIAAPGVGATVVCPGAIATNIITAERNRPADLQRTATPVDPRELGEFMAWAAAMTTGPRMPPSEAAEIVLADLEANALHSLPNGSAVAARAWIDRLLVDLPPD
jgi:NAD(P)-dependent dehydrogenase (short-subunit alcohol dehydrogenase family)